MFREEFHCPSVVWGVKILTYVVYEKSTWYVVKFRAQRLAIVFQNKSLFNLVKDLFNWIEGLGRSVTVRVQSEWERVLTYVVYEKVLDTLSNFALKNSLKCFKINRFST